MPSTYWSKVLFSDECKIEALNYNGRPLVRRNNQSNPFLPQYLKPKVKFPASLMIWGCFSINGTGRLEIIDKPINANDYIQILENKLIPSRNVLFEGNDFIFQDDSAPIHRAKKVKQWMEKNHIEQLEWPSNSPGLNS